MNLDCLNYLLSNTLYLYGHIWHIWTISIEFNFCSTGRFSFVKHYFLWSFRHFLANSSVLYFSDRHCNHVSVSRELLLPFPSIHQKPNDSIAPDCPTHVHTSSALPGLPHSSLHRPPISSPTLDNWTVSNYMVSHLQPIYLQLPVKHLNKSLNATCHPWLFGLWSVLTIPSHLRDSKMLYFNALWNVSHSNGPCLFKEKC